VDLMMQGLLPIRPNGKKLATRPFAEQVVQVLANLEAVLSAAGTGFDHLISVRVYITSVDDW
jgi:enamine deaminase RidA (YjgF/YER057c/UK114 family)